MSTSQTAIAFNNNSLSNTSFRAWALAIATALQAVGMVQTADTGQINLATATITGVGANGYAGYEIYRFNDALQATKPVFMKIEYGSGASNVSQPLVRVTVSNGTNGAGTLNGTLISPSFIFTGYIQIDTVPVPCYFFGDTSSVVFTLPASVSSSPGRMSIFALERTRDAVGAADGDGLVAMGMQGYGYGSGVSFGNAQTWVASFLTTTAGTTANVLPMTSPSYYGFWDSAGSLGDQLMTFPFIVGVPKVKPQLLSLLGCYAAAASKAVTASVVVSGSAHTYLALGGEMYAACEPGPGGNAGFSQSAVTYGGNSISSSLMMRWE